MVLSHFIFTSNKSYHILFYTWLFDYEVFSVDKASSMHVLHCLHCSLVIFEVYKCKIVLQNNVLNAAELWETVPQVVLICASWQSSHIDLSEWRVISSMRLSTIAGSSAWRFGAGAWSWTPSAVWSVWTSVLVSGWWWALIILDFLTRGWASAVGVTVSLPHVEVSRLVVWLLLVVWWLGHILLSCN